MPLFGSGIVPEDVIRRMLAEEMQSNPKWDPDTDRGFGIESSILQNFPEAKFIDVDPGPKVDVEIDFTKVPGVGAIGRTGEEVGGGGAKCPPGHVWYGAALQCVKLPAPVPPSQVVMPVPVTGGVGGVPSPVTVIGSDELPRVRFAAIENRNIGGISYQTDGRLPRVIFDDVGQEWPVDSTFERFGTDYYSGGGTAVIQP